MIWTLWTRKEIVLVAAILALAGASAFLSVKLIRPQPFASSVLTEWQCTRTAGILTVCTKAVPPRQTRADRGDDSGRLLASAR
ncbi:MAG TPA: hypothetical protein VHB49_25245 [Bradyrhizobium sp.]|nr:hypothetical protein [Bradyrhizobium sp.]